MDTLSLIGGVAGGVGLFLLGMGLMSDGLRLAAGPALERILARSTGTRLRGLGSGILVTAIVQSSSAVTVAVIGFVNAGLLSLGGALWVMFGANVGTTMTGWLVALIGMEFDIDALALPMIGIGMLLRLTGEGTRRGALGMALAGFGVLFLGIDMLKESFSGLSADFRMPPGSGVIDVLTLVFIGIILTVLMQSSSAALVVILTAAQSGLIAVEGAAAAVIGANIGTTTTALLAVIGATPNAKRAAVAHVLFNVLTAVVALLILPWLLDIVAFLGALLLLDAGPAVQLALFHTTFNILGVILIWPLAGRLTGFLSLRFRSAEEDAAHPRYLDKTVLAVPTLALAALEREIRNLGGIALATVRTAFDAASPELKRNQQIADRLSNAIADFIAQLYRRDMTTDSAQRLPQLLRVARYYEAATELAAEGAEALCEADGKTLPDVPGKAEFCARAEALFACIDPTAGNCPGGDIDAFEEAYQRLKAALLEAGASGHLPVATMDASLRGASALRRAVDQVVKAAQLLTHLRNYPHPPQGADLAKRM